MGLIVSAALNSNGNPQIYGSDTFQSGSGQPIVENPTSHRVIIEHTATDISITITQADLDKTVDDTATAAAGASFIASVESNTGLSGIYDQDLHAYVFTGDAITTNTTLYGEDAFYVDTSGSTSLYGSFPFVFDDATQEDHNLFITSNETVFRALQTSCSNTVTLVYRDALYDFQNPLDDWGVIDKGSIKYEYSTDLGDTYEVAGVVPTLDPVVLTLDDAYPKLYIRATRTVLDSSNNIIYESITNMVGGSEYLSMTECTPTLSVSLSDLYCGCSTIDVTDATTYQNRDNWYVSVFTRNIVDSTPYYKGPEIGNNNFVGSDNKWTISIPSNGAYSFRIIAVKKYSGDYTYSTGDWVYNPSDGKLYVSNSNLNEGNSLSNLTYWRQWNHIQDLETVFSKTSNTFSGTFLYQELSKTVTCNTSDAVTIKNRKSCDSSCSTIVFEDVTGDYDFEFNPKGYGAPNYRRDEYANVYFLVNSKSDGTDLVYLPAWYNYTSSMSILFDIPRDGWYRLHMFQVELYDTSKRYNKFASVYDATNNSFYVSLADNNTFPLDNTLAWMGIATYAEFAASVNFGTWQWDHLVKCNGEATLDSIGRGVISDKCGQSCVDELLKKYDLVYIYLSAACRAFEVYDFQSAQCYLESIPKNCAPYMGGTTTGCGC